jgi:spore coat polysaccharide biosynthesis protein SpsF
MVVCAIIQARTESTRLPGKVLEDIGGASMLSRVVSRVKKAKLVNRVVVATTEKTSDDLIVDECKQLSVDYYRGSELDVLDRYYRATQTYNPDTIVRITSDCPLIDPDIIDSVVEGFLGKSFDYASNTIEPSFPRGLDTEAMTAEALYKAWQEAKKDYQRVHVTPYIYENPEIFNLLSITNKEDYSDYRWTVDELEDLLFIRAVYSSFNNSSFSWKDVIHLLEKQPHLLTINQNVQQKKLDEC